MSLFGRLRTGEVSGTRAALACVLILVAFLLAILNWRSGIAIRTFSSNVDLIVFLLGVTVLPLVLLWYATRLPHIWSAILSTVALCMLAFSAVGWLWSFHSIGRMASRIEVQPLLASVSFGKERIAAYEVETGPAGAYVALRHQYRIAPGLFVSREFAVINAPVIDKLTILPDLKLCVTFPSVEDGTSSRPSEFRVTLPIEPLFQRLAAPTLIDSTNASVARSAADCEHSRS